jgi:hypothetical protein
MKNNKTVRAGSFERNSNATAAGAEGGVELDLYSLSDRELAGVQAGSEFPPLGRFAVRDMRQ